MSFLWVLFFLRFASATFKNYDDLPETDFFMPGDINLGLITPLTKDLCKTWYPRSVQAANAVIFRVNEINHDTSILPNVTLGVVILDDCWDIARALYQTTKLIPADDCTNNGQPLKNVTHPTGYYDVAATIISYESGTNVPQSRLLSMYKIPHVSMVATADILSDRKQFGYFNRVVPPDKYQTKVIMDMIIAFNWTYISLIGAPSVYSRNGITEIRVMAKKYGICIAYSVELLHDVFVDEDYDEVVRRLRIHSKAKVVIVFSVHSADILNAVKRAKAYGEFIFFGADGFELPIDASSINYLKIDFALEKTRPYESFVNYYKTLSPWAHYDTPGIFEKHTPEDWHCSMELEKGKNGSCLNYEVLGDLPQHSLSNTHRAFIDVFNVMVFALDTLIRQRCPAAFNDKLLLKECITGPELLKFIRNTTFHGYRRHVRFNVNGDGLSDYDIRQMQPDGLGGAEYVTVGKFLIEKEVLNMDMKKLKWYSLNQSLHLTPTTTPESVCAKPCKPGEFYIQGEDKCCWECRHCRENEVVRDDLKGCNVCPVLTWPRQESFTTCEAILPSYMDWIDPIGLVMLGISAIGLLSTIAILCIFIQHRTKKVVKGSSLEQMMTIILALFLSYTTAILLVAKPIYSLCLIQYYSFHLSCTLTFVPLFLKTTRVYRIFAAAEKCQQVRRFISSKALALFSLTLISILVAILVVCTIFYDLGQRLQMPVSTEKFVELVCHISSESLLIPLSYNLLLLLLCAVYGFLTRKLPENFNESWYIFISVTTTLFVWLAFLPTYSMAFYAYHKSALLGLALILNAVVTAVCLFAPKIYAIYYIPEDSIKVTNFEGTQSTGGSSQT